jgi:hypothetical protein
MVLAITAPGAGNCSQDLHAFRLGPAIEVPLALDRAREIVTVFYDSLESVHLAEGPVTCASSTPSRGLLPALGGPFVLDQDRGTWAEAPLPSELAGFRFAQPSACVGAWRVTPIQADPLASSVVWAGARIAPGTAWLAAGSSTAAPSRVVELRCAEGAGCETRDLTALLRAGAVRAMFPAPDGDVWLSNAEGCLLHWSARSSSVAERLCGAPTGMFSNSLDGPRTSTAPFELFATFQGLPMWFDQGRLEPLTLPFRSDHVLWLGPGEAIFPANATGTSTGPSPLIGHRLPDGRTPVEMVPPDEGLEEVTSARTIPALGPMLGVTALGSRRDLIVRGAGGWSLYATTMLFQENLTAISPFRDGVLYGTQTGLVGQISRGRECGKLGALGAVDLRVLVDLGLSDESLIGAGISNYAYRILPER